MDRNFDIFKIGPIGNALWRDSGANSTAAKSRVAKLSMVVPGEYLNAAAQPELVAT